METARAELMAMPSSKEIVARYEAMNAEVRAAVGAAFPNVHWEQKRPANYGGCSKPFDHQNGKTHYFPLWVAAGGFSDADWPRAVTVVANIVGKYGFSSATSLADTSANHEVTFPDAYGGNLDFGSGVNTILSVTTACHLPNSERGPASH